MAIGNRRWILLLFCCCFVATEQKKTSSNKWWTRFPWLICADNDHSVECAAEKKNGQKMDDDEDLTADDCLNWRKHSIIASNGLAYHDAFDHGETIESVDNTKCRRIGARKGRFCLRTKSGQKAVLSKCEKQTTAEVDNGVSCRPARDRMTWYRGAHSRTVSKQPCLRWDSDQLIERHLPFYSWFHAFDQPGVGDSSSENWDGVSSQENHCRNPDNSPAGPWCYLQASAAYIREPCFPVCSAYISNEFCLRRSLFSWLIKMDDAALAVKKLKLSVLSQLLSTSTLVMNAEGTAISSSHNGIITDAEMQPKCFQMTPVVGIAGPWTYSGDVNDPAWRPCFLSCEDTALSCLPSHRQDFLYYGARSSSVSGRSCLQFDLLYERLLIANASLDHSHSEFPKVNFLVQLLTSDFEVGYTSEPLVNWFARGRGNRLRSNRCLNLSVLLRKTANGGEDFDWKRKLSILRRSSPFFAEQLNAIIRRGPGCFVDRRDHSSTQSSDSSVDQVHFETCFHQCPQGMEVEPVVSQNP